MHLDSPLRSLALKDEALAELIGNATRRAFVRIVDLCLEERVDALLLAGDLYDGEQTSMKTALFLAAQMRRLAAAGIRVFVIRGNHDAMSRITKELTLPDNVHVFGGRAEVIEIARGTDGPDVAIHGLSFALPQAPESLLPKYRPPVAGAINIGLMHTSLDGAEGHDVYAPCSLADLRASGHAYWALGHVHKRAVHAEPRCTVVMPGIPQGRAMDETGPKSATLVSIAADGAVEVTKRLTAIAEFERVRLDVTGLDDWRGLVEAMGRALERARRAASADHLVARLHLVGVSPLAWRLRAESDLLAAEARDRAEMVGATAIEGIESDVEPPPRTPTTGEADPIDELRRLALSDVLASDAFRAELTEIAEELRRQLPQEAREALGTDEATFAATLTRVAGEGVDDVVARLAIAPRAEAP